MGERDAPRMPVALAKVLAFAILLGLTGGAMGIAIWVILTTVA